MFAGCQVVLCIYFPPMRGEGPINPHYNLYLSCHHSNLLSDVTPHSSGVYRLGRSNPVQQPAAVSPYPWPCTCGLHSTRFVLIYMPASTIDIIGWVWDIGHRVECWTFQTILHQNLQPGPAMSPLLLVKSSHDLIECWYGLGN